MKLSDWALSKLKLATSPAHPLGPLEASFRFSCKTAMDIDLPHRLDEESMTGALLGMMATNFPWCVAAFGYVQGAKCSWARYRKGGRTKHSESVTGADFALVINPGGGIVRLAIFQAKKVKETQEHGLHIDVHHRPKPINGQVRVTQFSSLVNTGFSILGDFVSIDFPSQSDIDTFNSLDWIHYLAYMEKGIKCKKISDLDGHWMASRKQDFKGPSVAHVDDKFIDLIKILSDGCLPHGERPDGWLHLEEIDARNKLPDLIDIMDVYVGDEGRGGLTQKLIDANEVKGIVEECAIDSELDPTPDDALRSANKKKYNP